MPLRILQTRTWLGPTESMAAACAARQWSGGRAARNRYRSNKKATAHSHATEHRAGITSSFQRDVTAACSTPPRCKHPDGKRKSTLEAPVVRAQLVRQLVRHELVGLAVLDECAIACEARLQHCPLGWTTACSPKGSIQQTCPWSSLDKAFSLTKEPVNVAIASGRCSCVRISCALCSLLVSPVSFAARSVKHWTMQLSLIGTCSDELDLQS